MQDTYSRRKMIKAAALSGLALTQLGRVNAEELSTSIPNTNSTLKKNKSIDGVDLFEKKWNNWAGNISSHPQKIEHPKNLKELQEIIKKSDRVRVLGTGHSFNASVKTDKTLIRTDKLKKILSLDTRNHRVEVEAGMKLHEFNEMIWKQGYCLPSLGDIQEQSLAGLISTATHGTGLKWGSTSDELSVHGVKIVLASGELLILNADDPNHSEYLKAARVSMGLLGVIYSITFNLTPAHNLKMVTKKVTLAEALKAENYLNHDHYEFFYFPYTDKAQAIYRDITDEPASSPSPVVKWFNDIFMENIALDAILRVGAHRPKLMIKIMPWLADQLTDENVVGKSYEIMTSTRLSKFVEGEWAIPLESIREATEIFKQTVDDFAYHQPQDKRFYLSMPFEVRFMKQDTGSFMGPAGYRDTAFVSINLHQKFEGYNRFLEAFEANIAHLNPRPHWGKLFYKNPMAMYPMANQFLQIREKLDPKGKFLNEFFLRVINNHRVGE